MKRAIACILALVLMLSCVMSAGALGFIDWLLSDDEDSETSWAGSTSGDTTWAIYWYLCGSDLESDGGYASEDLYEMMSATLSENVTVVIQTGGSSAWEWDEVSPKKIGRYVCNQEGMFLIEQLPQANMGDRKTLESFLSFCKENYPADKEMVIFWDHGGGSCGGVCYDENYDDDYLTIQELHSAMSAVFSSKSGEPELEFVGFDTCLMGSIDTAAAMEGIAHYMIASEETEPGCGWNYEGLLTNLSKNTDMDSAEFGRIVCDTYMEGCEYIESEDEATLSVIDLTKLSDLREAYEAFGQEALDNADSAFFASYSRGARKTENYGGNTRNTGYCDMADLGDLVINNMSLFPSSADSLLTALEECVVYSCNGAYRTRAQGLSCFYPYSGDIDMLASYSEGACGTALPNFYQQMLLGEPEQSGTGTTSGVWSVFQQFGSQTENDDVPSTNWITENTGLFGHSAPVAELPEELPIEVDDDLVVHLNVPQNMMELVSGLYIQMYAFDLDRDTMIYLGRDTNISGYWDDGEFSAEFLGTWGAIDGHICYMEPVFESMDYNIYNVPILLNGEECQLIVVYDYEHASYKITGAREGLEEGLMSSKRLILLNPGDTVTTLVYTSSLDDDSDYIYGEEYETFTVTENTKFEDDFLPDGYYYTPFELVDYRSNSVYTDSPVYALEDGNISILEDE